MATKQQGALPGAPGNSAPGDAATDGAAGDPPALKTHKHGREAFATPGSSAVGDSATAGSAATIPRSDHTHGRETFATPGSSAVGDSATAGTATTVPRSDHKHGRESFATPAVVLGSAAAAGSATTPIRSDATVAAFDTTVPGLSLPSDAATVGTVAFSARRDHIHGRETATPLLISGLQMWFKADTLGLADGTAVGSWSDSSGNANTLTQATAGNKPTFKTNIINGLPVVRFVAANSTRMATAGTFVSKPFFAIAVVRPSSFAVYGAMASGTADNGIEWRLSTSAHQGLNKQAAVDILDGTATLVVNVAAVLSASYDGSGNAAFFTNGTADGTALNNQTFATGARTIGAALGSTNEFFNGDIAEYIEYNVALTARARQALEGYLAAKYAIAVSWP